ncbi:MAG: hypothetical protein NT118_08135 [Lentisphaerae bacterium]|nr:hypothetical protein [Lentisphaerota bacterium]
MHFTGKKVYLNIFNPVTGDLVTLARRGEDWNNWELVSSFVDTGFIDGKKTVIKAKKKPQQSEVAPAFPG